MAWQMNGQWKYEPDLEKSSEVEVRFTPEGVGETRVDLEHRRFERIGEGGEAMRKGVGEPNGWSVLLQMYTARVESN
jgi:hypothetical protein